MRLTNELLEVPPSLSVVVFDHATAFFFQIFELPGGGRPPERDADDHSQNERQWDQDKEGFH